MRHASVIFPRTSVPQTTTSGTRVKWLCYFSGGRGLCVHKKHTYNTYIPHMLQSLDPKSRRPTCDARRTAPIVVHARCVNRSVPLFSRFTIQRTQSKSNAASEVAQVGRAVGFLRMQARTLVSMEVARAATLMQWGEGGFLWNPDSKGINTSRNIHPHAQ
jgi:hypothetical protein